MVAPVWSARSAYDRMEKSLDSVDWADAKVLVRPHKRSFTIFEGTSEIQHPVIARASPGCTFNSRNLRFG